MSAPRWLTTEEGIVAHGKQLERFGGPPGIRRSGRARIGVGTMAKQVGDERADPRRRIRQHSDLLKPLGLNAHDPVFGGQTLSELKAISSSVKRQAQELLRLWPR